MSKSIRDAILRHGDPNYRAVKPKVIAKKLGLLDENLPRVKKCIKRLVKEGKLAYGPSHRVCSFAKAPYPRSKRQPGQVSPGQASDPSGDPNMW